MKLYKLTNENGFTQNQTEWYEGVIHSLVECDDPTLCSGDVFHAYTNKHLALLLNPIHADFYAPRLFECVGKVVVSDWGKVGCFELEVIKENVLPKWYTDDDTRKCVSVQFAILCAEAVLHVYEDKYTDDRPRKAIEAAKEYLNNLNKSSAAACDDAAACAAAAADAAACDAAACAAACAAAACAAACDAAAARAAARAADAADACDAAARAADAAPNFEYMAEQAVEMVCGK